MGDLKRHFEAFHPTISHLENLFIVGEKLHLDEGWIAAARWDNEENNGRKPGKIMRKTNEENQRKSPKQAVYSFRAFGLIGQPDSVQNYVSTSFSFTLKW